MTLQNIADQLQERVTGSSFDQTVKFVIGDEGSIMLEGNTVSLADKPADCTIRVSRDDLESLVAGELSPTSAFMQGKLKVEGDMSAAMALSSLL